MLADEIGGEAYSGALDSSVCLSGEWFDSLINFIGNVLPAWRDDPIRPCQTSENSLTAQLCSRLTSASRHTPGWDFLQFKREEPDDADGRRSIDIAIAPAGTVIWIEGREYTEYQTLLPIECKRLPTPVGSKRDEREYIYSCFSSTGGIQRFKAGHHGAAHSRAAMIGYIQADDIATWTKKFDQWIDELESAKTEDWSLADKLSLSRHNTMSRMASLRSIHVRHQNPNRIIIDHLWIEM
ncbi:MAG: hypothetical protein PHE74_10360 [Comamonas sp.]|nr:hypothetical protein [Comamonas sp.]